MVERLYLMFYGRTNHDLMSSTMWSLAPQPAGPSVSVAEDDGKDNLVLVQLVWVRKFSVVVNLICTDILCESSRSHYMHKEKHQQWLSL